MRRIISLPHIRPEAKQIRLDFNSFFFRAAIVACIHSYKDGDRGQQPTNTVTVFSLQAIIIFAISIEGNKSKDISRTLEQEASVHRLRYHTPSGW